MCRPFHLPEYQKRNRALDSEIRCTGVVVPQLESNNERTMVCLGHVWIVRVLSIYILLITAALYLEAWRKMSSPSLPLKVCLLSPPPPPLPTNSKFPITLSRPSLHSFPQKRRKEKRKKESKKSWDRGEGRYKLQDLDARWEKCLERYVVLWEVGGFRGMGRIWIEEQGVGRRKVESDGEKWG